MMCLLGGDSDGAASAQCGCGKVSLLQPALLLPYLQEQPQERQVRRLWVAKKLAGCVDLHFGN